MQTKSFFAAVLTGVLCLSACVKNVESPEVTALRNARADEIRANAELLRANAELAKAQASVENARVAYLNAQTAYQNAMAATEEARKALIQAETETELARAADLLAQAELAQIQAEQALRQAQYEQELAELQHELAMLQAQLQLADAIAQANLTANNNLITLVNQYNAAATTLYNQKEQVRTYEDNIANFQQQIADLEAGILDPEEANAEDIANWQAEIARLNKQLEAIKAYQTASPEELQDKLNDARVVLIQAQTDYQNKLQAENNAMNAFYEQRNRVYNNTVYYNYAYYNSYYIHNYVYSLFYNPFGYINKYNTEKEVWEYGFNTPGEDPEFVLLWEQFYWDYADGENYPAAKDGIIPSYSEWIEPSISFVGGNHYADGFEALYTAAKKTYEDALAAAEALDPADPAAVETATQNLADFEEGWAELKGNLKTALDGKTAFDAEVKKAVDAYAAWITAKKARIDAQVVRNDAQDEFYAIQTNLTYYDEYGNPRDVATTIETLEANIEWLEELIENAIANTENANANIEAMIENLETQIAWNEERIAELQERIAVQEKVVADLKAQLEEAMTQAADGAE